MAIYIEMPKLSDTMTEGLLGSWLKSVGDTIARGDIIAEVETDKATMGLEAFDSGILLEQRVTLVVMESTGDYWKPFYYLLEDLPGVEVMLVNARHVKNLPGRKTDVADATWLAQLGAHGLVRGSFVPRNRSGSCAT